MKNGTLILAFLFYALAGNAQPSSTLLTGKVVSETGEPLAGVTIYLKNQSAGTRSNMDGSFQLKISEPDVVIFTYTGWAICAYTLPEIELEFNNIIVLTESGLVIPETVITAKKYNRNPVGCTCCCFITCPEKNLPITITLAAREWSYAPNPTRDAVVIQTPEAAGNILIYAMNGSAVTRVNVTEAATRVELAAYAAGIYLMYFENAGVAQSIGKVVLVNN